MNVNDHVQVPYTEHGVRMCRKCVRAELHYPKCCVSEWDCKPNHVWVTRTEAAMYVLTEELSDKSTLVTATTSS